MTLGLLLLSGIPNAAADQVLKRLICGRVVDDRGASVAGAVVTLGPAALKPTWGTDILVPGTFSEKDGAFCVESYEREIKDTYARHYVTTACREGDLTLINPPFGGFSSRPPAFTGKLISVKTDRADVGDTNLQVVYPHVTLRILDRSGRPVLTQQEQWSPVWLRVKDRKGTVVHEGGLSLADIESAVDLTHSTLNIALPQGVWRIEVALEGVPPNISGTSPKGKWIKLSTVLVLTSCQNPTEVSLVVAKPFTRRRHTR